MDKLRQRVSNAEEQLKGVRAENTRLRQDKLDAGCAPEDAHEQAMAAAAAARREPAGRGRNQEEIETLHRELREAQVKHKKNPEILKTTNLTRRKKHIPYAQGWTRCRQSTFVDCQARRQRSVSGKDLLQRTFLRNDLERDVEAVVAKCACLHSRFGAFSDHTT